MHLSTSFVLDTFRDSFSGFFFLCAEIILHSFISLFPVGLFVVLADICDLSANQLHLRFRKNDFWLDELFDLNRDSTKAGLRRCFEWNQEHVVKLVDDFQLDKVSDHSQHCALSPNEFNGANLNKAHSNDLQLN